MGENWLKQRRGEYFYRRAKAEKYRARSAYKLLELQNKFHLIKEGDVVVDLGAAPGSWSQVALELVGKTGKVIGVDVKTVSGLDDNFVFVLGDISKNRTIERIKENLPKLANVVLSDVSPEFSGIRTKDIGLAIDFSLRALEIARQTLAEGGHFVTKAFRGAGYNELVAAVKQNFVTVKEVKPKASQKESAEIYVVGLKFKRSKQPLTKEE